jgi:conjugal transfer/type IV secretion protein DotA/TraY
MVRNLKSKYLSVCAGLGAWLYASAAMAQSSMNLFTPVAGDKSISMLLQPIFGSDLFTASGIASGGSGGSTPFETAMGILNGIALLVGGFLTFYVLVVGTMMTAHDGENLGRKWSSVWVPIRTAIGTAMVVPVSGGAASGYCAAQLLMGWLITQGIGAADQLWSGYVQSAYSAQGMAPTSVLPKVEPLAFAILKSEVCMTTVNQVLANDPSANGLIPSQFTASDLVDSGTGAVIGRQYGSGQGECGTIRYTTLSSAVSAAGQTFGFGDSMNGVQIDWTSVQNAHIAAAKAMEPQMQAIASAIVTTGPKSASSASFTQAVTAYQQSVANVAGNSGAAQSAFGAMQQSASADGWLLAGAWFSRASAVQDQVNSIVTAVPSATDPIDFNPLLQGPLDQNYAALSQYQSQASQQELGPAQENARDQASGNLAQKVAGFIMTSALSGLQHLIQPNPDRNGIMSIKDIGSVLMVGSEAMVVDAGMLKVGGNSIVGKAIGFFTGADKGVDLAADLMLALATPMFLLGATLAVYIPMLPFMIYFGTVIGWVILVAEAVIAAPLWGIMHLNPNGDEMAGAARQGYMMVLGLMLRPVLIVLGFIFACLAVDPLIKLFESVFFPVFQASMAGSLIGVGTLLTMAFIFATSMMLLINRTFGFIHVIPDQLLRWIGGGHEQLGQYGGGMGEGAKAGVAMGAGKLMGGVSNASGAVGRYKQAGAEEDARNERKQMERQQLAAQEGQTKQEAANGVTAALGNAQSMAQKAHDAGDSAAVSNDPVEHLKALRAHKTAKANFATVEKQANSIGDTQTAQDAVREGAASANAMGEHYSAIANNAKAMMETARDSGSAGDIRVAQNALRTAEKAADLAGEKGDLAEFGTMRGELAKMADSPALGGGSQGGSATSAATKGESSEKNA